jgi:amino acid transporter
MRKLFGYLGVAIFIALFAVGFVAYFVRTFDPATHTWYDGLGRRLWETPWYVRFIFGQEHDWPGWQWFIADLVIFWGGVGIGAMLVQLGFKSQDSNKEKS